MDGSNVFSLIWLSASGEADEPIRRRRKSSKIVLSWERTDELSYNVYRWGRRRVCLSSRGTLRRLAASQFTDEGLQNGKTYKYEVRAVENGGSDAVRRGQRAVISATPRKMTPPQTPGPPKLEEKKDGGVLLS